MKFTTTKNKKIRLGIGYVPNPWIETKLEDHKEIIANYFESSIRLWDFNIGGDEQHDFLFDDGKAFRLYYEWWRDDWANEDESTLKAEYYIEEISAEEANVPGRKDRNWL